MDKVILRKGRVCLLTGFAIVSARLLSGCGGGGSGGSGGDESTSARFSFTLTSYLSQTVASQPAAASQPLAVSLVSGQLSVTNTATFDDVEVLSP